MRYQEYDNKICIVTGSSEGIGLETAKKLLENKAIVYGLDKIKTPLNGINYIECDLANKSSIDEAFKKIPNHIDSFFGNAAVSGIHDTFKDTYTINFIANKYITEEYLKQRMKPGGSICFVSSFLGNYWDKYSSEFKDLLNQTTWNKMQEVIKNDYPYEKSGLKAYPLSKRALNYYMSKTSLELGRLKIRVNSIVPGTTNTKLIDDFKNDDGTINEAISRTGVAGRIAHPEEIANVLLFINSNQASYINGIILPVDYGDTTEITLGKKSDKFDLKINSTLFNYGTLKMINKNNTENEIEII